MDLFAIEGLGTPWGGGVMDTCVLGKAWGHLGEGMDPMCWDTKEKAWALCAMAGLGTPWRGHEPYVLRHVVDMDLLCYRRSGDTMGGGHGSYVLGLNGEGMGLVCYGRAGDNMEVAWTHFLL